MNCLREAGARWAPGDGLHRVLDQVSGDIVQAIQALKESRPETTSALFDQLQGLLTSLEAISGYCSSATPEALGYPLTRAERQVRDVISFLYPDAAASPASSQAAKIISISAEKRRVDIETFQLGPHRMPRVFNGLWQLSSPAWGSASAETQEAALAELVELGLSTAGEWTWAAVRFGGLDLGGPVAAHMRSTRAILRTPHEQHLTGRCLPTKSGNCLLTEPSSDMADHYGDAELVYGDFRNRLPADMRDATYAATKWCVFGPIDKPVTTQYVLQAVKERSRRLGGRVELLQFHWHDVSIRSLFLWRLPIVGTGFDIMRSILQSCPWIFSSSS